VPTLANRLSSIFDIVSRTGLLDPRRAPSLTAATARWGPTAAAPYAASALASPNRRAVIDESGGLSYTDLDRQSTQLAKGLHHLGARRGERLGIACRNHRDFIELTVAAAKAGLGVVYLNTSFAAPQMREVVEREGLAVLAVDLDLLHLMEHGSFDAPLIVAGPDEPIRAALADGFHTMSEVRRDGDDSGPLRASLPVPPVLLTSGTTGTPKGAQRSNRVDPTAATAIIDRIPYRHDDVIAITSPLFHAWGLAQMLLASALGATTTLMASFDAEATLAQIERERVTVLAVVPAILQRLLASPALDTTDLSSLRIVASSGSALPVPVVQEWLDRVGPNHYNLYGSTEVGQATLATPADLAAEPATAGRILPGSVVAILDAGGTEVEPGTIGRIFVGSGAQFEQYTGGGGKEIIDGLMSSGDVGHFDSEGRLFVTGRADDMIVSGGENVYPREVEELLLTHPDIVDAAVYGVDDDDFGQRLAAQIVTRSGGKITKRTVTTLVSSQLARHKVPRDIHFVDTLPRNTTGKLLRSQLSAG